MKPRHAAALALVGWYLLVPPADATDRAPVIWELVVPLKGRDSIAGGYFLAHFNTQEQCEKRLAEVQKPGFKLSGASGADFARATCQSYFRPNLLLNDHSNH
jgi:hypothetical protein